MELGKIDHERRMDFVAGLLGNAGVVELAELTAMYSSLLVEGEEISIGFKLIRDTFVFTNKRLILVDVQGVSGKKVEYMSIIYSKVTRFSVESAGIFDLDADLKIWVGSSAAPIRKRFNRNVNIYELQSVLAEYVLN